MYRSLAAIFAQKHADFALLRSPLAAQTDVDVRRAPQVHMLKQSLAPQVHMLQQSLAPQVHML